MMSTNQSVRNPTTETRPMKCTICRHPDLVQIELDMMDPSQETKEIAKRYGVHQDSLRRHMTNHAQENIQKAMERRKRLSTKAILDRTDEMICSLKAAYDKAEAEDDKQWMKEFSREIRAWQSMLSRFNQMPGFQQQIATQQFQISRAQFVMLPGSPGDDQSGDNPPESPEETSAPVSGSYLLENPQAQE